MGGTESNNRYGGMVVQTDAPFYISGTQVTGKINVQIDQEFPAERLKLKVQGTEYCRWYESKIHDHSHEGNNMKSHYKDKHDHNETIFLYETVIYEFNQSSIKVG